MELQYQCVDNTFLCSKAQKIYNGFTKVFRLLGRIWMGARIIKLSHSENCYERTLFSCSLLSAAAYYRLQEKTRATSYSTLQTWGTHELTSLSLCVLSPWDRPESKWRYNRLSVVIWLRSSLKEFCSDPCSSSCLGCCHHLHIGHRHSFRGVHSGQHATARHHCDPGVQWTTADWAEGV